MRLGRGSSSVIVHSAGSGLPASQALPLMIAFSPFQALGPAIAEDHYGEAAVFGAVAAVSGAGSVLGSALALRWRPRRPLLAGQVVLVGWSLNYLGYAAGLPVPVVVPFALASGVGIALFIVWWETTLALRVPPQALSRGRRSTGWARSGSRPSGCSSRGRWPPVWAHPRRLRRGPRSAS